MLDWQEKMAEAVIHIENLLGKLEGNPGSDYMPGLSEARDFVTEARDNIGSEWFKDEGTS